LATKEQPLEIECPECNGLGCEQCNDSGYVSVEGCPTEFARPVFPTVRLIEFFEKGMPPISGGTLEQSASFLRAVSFFQQDEASLKNE
jgi:hypothetical protein